MYYNKFNKHSGFVTIEYMEYVLNCTTNFISIIEIKFDSLWTTRNWHLFNYECITIHCVSIQLSFIQYMTNNFINGKIPEINILNTWGNKLKSIKNNYINGNSIIQNLQNTLQSAVEN